MTGYRKSTCDCDCNSAPECWNIGTTTCVREYNLALSFPATTTRVIRAPYGSGDCCSGNGYALSDSHTLRAKGDACCWTMKEDSSITEFTDGSLWRVPCCATTGVEDVSMEGKTSGSWCASLCDGLADVSASTSCTTTDTCPSSTAWFEGTSTCAWDPPRCSVPEITNRLLTCPIGVRWYSSLCYNGTYFDLKVWAGVAMGSATGAASCTYNSGTAAWEWSWGATSFLPTQANIESVCTLSSLYNGSASDFWHWRWTAVESPCNIAISSGSASLISSPTTSTINDCARGTDTVYNCWYYQCDPFTPTWVLS